jgi:phosphotransferase system HPr-like phosphotransfer protein
VRNYRYRVTELTPARAQRAAATRRPAAARPTLVTAAATGARVDGAASALVQDHDAAGQSAGGAGGRAAMARHTDLTDLESPVTLTIRGSTERFARREGTDLTMDATANLRLSSTYASLSTRQLPVSIPPIGTVEETFVVKIPRGMKVRSAPMPTERKTEFGSYSITVESGGDRVTIRSRVAVGMREVKPADYAKWKTFCAEVDHAMSARLVIGPK